MPEPNEYQINIRQLLKTKRFLQRVMQRKQKAEIQAEIDAIDFAIARINDCENAKPKAKEQDWCKCIWHSKRCIINNMLCCSSCRKPINPKE